MSYRLLKVSELSGLQTDYSLVEGDLLQVSVGTSTAGPSLSTIKLSLQELTTYWNSTANTQTLWVSSGTGQYNNNTGSVAIGATTVSEKFVVRTSDSTDLMAISSQATGANGLKITLSSEDVSKYALHATGSAGAIDGLYVGSTGYVGIGTANPSTYVLEVDSGHRTGAVDIFELRNSDTSNSQAYGFSLNTNKDLDIFGEDGGGGVRYKVGTRGYMISGGPVGIGFDSTPTGTFHVKEHDDDCVIRTDTNADGYDSTVCFMQNSTSKGYAGYNDGDDTIALVYDTALDSTKGINIDAAGSIGIGIQNPGSVLHINGSSPNIQLTDSDTGADNFIDANSSLGGLQLLADHNDEVAESYIGFSVDGTREMYIETDGVGIGTSDPGATLHISSTGAMIIPVGTTTNRNELIASAGMVRFNSSDTTFEGYDGANWGTLGGVKDVDQDTFISAEASAGNDDDALFFHAASGTDAGNTRGADLLMVLSGTSGGGQLRPNGTSRVTLGETDNRWSTIYGVAGNFSGNVVVASTFTTQGDVNLGNDTGDTTTCAGGLTVADATVLNGSVQLGDETSDNININGYVHSNIVPDSNGDQSLGTTSLRWDAYIDQLYVTDNSMVTNLNADRVDGEHKTAFSAGLSAGTTTIGTKNTDGSAVGSTITVPFATTAGTANGITASYNDGLGTGSNVQFESIGVNTPAPGTPGMVRATNDVVFYFSDRRLKTDIQSIINPLDKLKSLNGVTYKPSQKAVEFGFVSPKRKAGVFADEVEKVLPEAVQMAPFDSSYDENGKELSITGDNYKTVQYEKLVPLLIEAVKELSEKVEHLERGK